MPGARLESFRLGDRTELLAELCLNTIAFTTRVPRQEDIGHDMFCMLSDVRDHLVWAGPSFTVQVKSDATALIFKKKHEIAWLKDLENPFFLVVCHREDLRIDIYSTWARLNGLLRKAASRVILQPGSPSTNRRQVWTAEDNSEQIISLGEPVVCATIQDFMDREKAGQLGQVLRQWVELDRENIVNNHAGMHWVIGPETYKPNQLFAPSPRMMVWVYWNAKNLNRCETNFARAATALRLTMAALPNNTQQTPLEAARINALDAVIREYGTVLDPASRHALAQFANLSIDDENGGPWDQNFTSD